MKSHMPAWLIGLAVIIVVEIVLANMFFGPACQAPGFVQFFVLIALPAVYVPLMFLTLRSSGNGGPSRG